MLGYLTDARIIQFFKLKRTTDPNVNGLTESDTLDLRKEGGLYFNGLLKATPQSLGFPDIEINVNGESLTVKQFLGFGGSSVVYQTIFQVVKLSL